MVNSMDSQNKGNLNGMKEIADYVGRSHETVLKMIRVAGLPAKKIVGSWVSSRSLIDAWIQEQALGGPKTCQAEKRPATDQRRPANP